MMEIEAKTVFRGRCPDLMAAWRPYLVFLKCLGIVSFRAECGARFWENPRIVYPFLVMFNSWAVFFVRWILHQTPSSNGIVAFLIGLSAMLSEIIGITALFVAGMRAKRFQALFDLWAQLGLKFRCIQQLETRLRLASWCILGAFLVFSVFHVSVYAVMQLQEEEVTVLKQMLFVMRVISMFVSIHTIGFAVLVCTTLWLLFDAVNTSLVDDFQKPYALHESLHAFNTQFRLAVTITSACDGIFSFVIGAYLIGHLCQMVFHTYVLLQELTSMFLSLHVYLMVQSVVVVLLCSVFPAMVHSQAHASYDILCCARIDHAAVPLQLLVISLQNRLSNSPIGLSAFGFQVLTKSLIPSVLSVYITYIFLVIQFKPPITESDLASSFGGVGYPINQSGSDFNETDPYFGCN